jgi:large subunit ribosomal protein L6
MSRVAKQPVDIPSGVEVKVAGQSVSVKGPQGALEVQVHEAVGVEQHDNRLLFNARAAAGRAMAGTMRSLVNNAVFGVSKGFQRKLELVGVGYRAQVQGNSLNLTLGYSHPIDYPVPDGVKVETPSQTEVVVKGIDKQKVGQVAAEIRAFRPPEPYKGKGVRYAHEEIVRKEAKKK